MIASSTYAAGRPCRELKNAAPGRGYERPRTAARTERRERDHGRAICTGLFVSTRATGRASLKTETHKSRPQVRLPASQFRTASHFLPAGATPRASSVSSAPLRASYFFRAIFRALGTRLSLRVNSVQEPTRGLSKCFNLSCALSHDRNLAWGSKHEVHRKSASGAQSSE